MKQKGEKAKERKKPAMNICKANTASLDPALMKGSKFVPSPLSPPYVSFSGAVATHHIAISMRQNFGFATSLIPVELVIVNQCSSSF